MRQSSVAEIKSNRRRHHNDKPREGSRLRRLYDLFMTGGFIYTKDAIAIASNKGCWGRARDQLMDFYGLEFESIPRKGWRCIGVWDGSYLVPLERIEQ